MYMIVKPVGVKGMSYNLLGENKHFSHLRGIKAFQLSQPMTGAQCTYVNEPFTVQMTEGHAVLKANFKHLHQTCSDMGPLRADLGKATFAGC